MPKESTYSAISKSLWLNSAMISKHLDNSLGAIHGIGLSEYMVLHNLEQAPGQTLRRIDIAEAIGRTASAVTRMLMPMEKIGLVEKVVNDRDARVSLVKITASGREIYTNASTTLDVKSKTLLKNIDSEEAKLLLDLLHTI